MTLYKDIKHIYVSILIISLNICKLIKIYLSFAQDNFLSVMI